MSLPGSPPTPPPLPTPLPTPVSKDQAGIVGPVAGGAPQSFSSFVMCGFVHSWGNRGGRGRGRGGLGWVDVQWAEGTGGREGGARTGEGEGEREDRGGGRRGGERGGQAPCRGSFFKHAGPSPTPLSWHPSLASITQAPRPCYTLLHSITQTSWSLWSCTLCTPSLTPQIGRAHV